MTLRLHHCVDARSFRPLWALEELGLPYELKILPFPPRALQKSYLGENVLGTVPLLVDGAARMTESSAIPHYLAMKHGAGRLGCGHLLHPQQRRRVASSGGGSGGRRKRFCSAV